MKLVNKSIAFISAFLLGLFLVLGLTSCGEEDPSKYAADALERLSLLLDEKVEASNENEENPGLTGDLEVPYSISVNDFEFVVTYTTDSTNAVPTQNVEAQTTVIKVTQTGETQSFTLTATIGEASKSWDFSIAKKDTSMIKTQAEVDAMANNLTYDQWAAATGGAALIQGYVTHAHDFSASYGNASVWLQDDNGGYYGYRVKVANEADYKAHFAVGNKIAIEGTISPYNGWQEMGAGCKYYYISDAQPKTYEFKDVTELWSANLATSAAATAVQNQKVKVTGKVTSIPEVSTDQMTLGISVGGNEYTVFFKKAYTTMPGDLNTTLKIGYTIEVEGYASVSKNGVQVCPGTPEAIKVLSTEVTAQDKVNGAVAEVKGQDVATSYYDSLEDAIELLTTTSAGCTVAYELKDVEGTGITLIDGNKLSVVVDANNVSKAKLVATITLEGATEAKTYEWNISTKTDANVISEIKDSVKKQSGLRLDYTAELVGSRQRLLVLTSPSAQELTYSYSVAENEYVKVGQFSSGQYYFDVKGVPAEGAAKVVLTCTFTYAGVETSVEFTIVLGEATAISIEQALALEDGASVLVQGVVTKIVTAYSDQYKNISVNLTDATGTLYLYRLAGNVQVGDIITVSGTMATYNGARQVAAGATFEKTGVSIEAALAAADGTNVVVAGTVKSIGTAWSDQYNNISVTITDGTHDLYLYRLATKVEAGDQIVVFGTMASYNGSRQVAQGAKAVITVAGTPVTPDKVTTIEAALAAEDGTLVELTGKVVNIKEAWSSYNNMSFTIQDEAGKEIYIFRTKTQVEMGDTVKVTGEVGSYNGSKQIAQGSTCEILEKAPVDPDAPTAEEVPADATQLTVTADPVVWVNTGESTDVTSHMAPENSGLTIVAYKNAWAGQGYSTEGYFYISKTDCRLYAANGNGGSLVVSITNNKIINLYITVTSGEVTVLVNGAAVSLKEGTTNVYVINATSFTLQNQGSAVAKIASIAFTTETPIEGGSQTPENPEPETPTKVTTITEALLAEDGTPVELVGKVDEIVEAWSSYNNMSFNLKDEAGNVIYIFRTKTQVGLGDTVKVTGVVGSYYESKQIAKDSTCEILEKAPEIEVPTDPEGTIVVTFDNKENRTVYSTEQQVWVVNGVTVTNDKAASTSNVGDYYNPARFYKGSNLTIEYTTAFTKLVIVTTGGKNFPAAPAIDGATVTLEGTVLTVEFATAVTSVFIENLGAQVRVAELKLFPAEGTTEPEQPEVEAPKLPEGAVEIAITSNSQGGSTYVFSEDKMTVTTTHAATANQWGRFNFARVAERYTHAIAIVKGTDMALGVKLDANNPNNVYDAVKGNKIYKGLEGYTVFEWNLEELGIDSTILEKLVFWPYDPNGSTTGEFTLVSLAFYGTYVEPEAPDYSNYNELDWQPAVGYWFSQDSGEKAYTLNTSQALYISSSVRFSKEDLPVGSIIVVKSGYQYRPDGWNTETTNTTGVRPGETAVEVIVVDEAWWGEYIYRAFNVSKIGKPALSEANFEEFKDAFKIYVPKTTEPETPVTPETPEQPEVTQTVDLKSFNNGTHTASYITSTNAEGWTAENSAVNSGNTAGSNSNPSFAFLGNDEDRAITLNGKVSAPGKLTSCVLSNGIKSLSFNYAQLFTDKNFSVTISIKDTQGNVLQSTVLTWSSGGTTADKYIIYTFNWTLDTPVEGDFVIEILNNCPSGNTGNKDRLTIWNITWLNA